VRFPWLNTAVTMDSTTLLHFLSNVTMETETFQCYMLHFLSNTTIEAETFRLLWRGDIKESWNELVRDLRSDAPVVFGALLIVIWELY
jgi:hypothetical protein